MLVLQNTVLRKAPFGEFFVFDVRGLYSNGAPRVGSAALTLDNVLELASASHTGRNH